ncbi:MAG: class I SAM-dependent methyltransferase, partial [Bacteroidia bacterium]|nr:class I SAM-dependent methyltransferase [Bacteroidia bacterium]
METAERKTHWENIYSTKELNEVSWYQPNPHTSLHFFEDNNVPFSANVIDIGGGDSFLTDKLIDIGYENVHLLDISEKAIERSKKRLGANADKVNYIQSDIVDFETDEQFDVWHDRAAFHFLTNEKEIQAYLDKVNRFIKPNGLMVIGTFSEEGPTKCSGIEISQYSEISMNAI